MVAGCEAGFTGETTMIQIHGVLLSPFVRKVLLTLEYKGSGALAGNDRATVRVVARRIGHAIAMEQTSLSECAPSKVAAMHLSL